MATSPYTVPPQKSGGGSGKVVRLGSLMMAFMLGMLFSMSRPLPYNSLLSAGASSLKSTGTKDVQTAVTTCQAKTEEEVAQLKKEISDYEKSKRYTDKIDEVQDKGKVAAHHQAIDLFLRKNVLETQLSSVLELGCAAGMMLQMVQRHFEGQTSAEDVAANGKRKYVGVELVTGWAKWAREYHKKIQVYEGDITEFSLPPEHTTFDFVMLNDVAEHIQKERYGCFFQQLQKVTHPGSLVYMHTPTPKAQLQDSDQYFENILPHHYIIMGMSLAGFELVAFEHDMDTRCGKGTTSLKVPKVIRNSTCYMNGWVKYYHVIFRRVDEPRVLTLA